MLRAPLPECHRRANNCASRACFSPADRSTAYTSTFVSQNSALMQRLTGPRDLSMCGYGKASLEKFELACFCGLVVARALYMTFQKLGEIFREGNALVDGKVANLPNDVRWQNERDVLL